MLTADTITDAQIRELQRHAELNIDNENRWWRAHQHLWTDSGEHNHDLLIGEQRNTIAICKSALNPQCHAERKAEARARCAEILAARAAKEGK